MLKLCFLIFIASDFSFSNEVPETFRRISELKCDEYKALIKSDCNESSPDCVAQTHFCSSGNEPSVNFETKVKPGEFPHMAAIGWKTHEERIEFYCDGSLISERFILTTSQCSKHADYGAPSLVRLGITNLALSDDAAAQVDVKIKRFLKFEGYDRVEHLNDIALIELETDVEFNGTFIRPVCLQQTEFSGEKLIASGWGKTSTYSEFSTDLMKFEILMKPLSYCENKLDLEDLPSGSQLCGSLNHEKECGGQGGSPIQSMFPDSLCMYSVVGLTSYGSPLCGKKFPLIFTKVSNYLDWIEMNVWPTTSI